MIIKYASKPNFNPNEADLSRQVVPNPFMGERPAYFSRRLCRLHTSNFSLPPSFLTVILSVFSTSVFSDFSVAKFKNDKTNPIFSRPNMRYQYQKQRNGGQKTTQKNETNPFVDNFRRPAGVILTLSETK
jgi:hypothetical protein